MKKRFPPRPKPRVDSHPLFGEIPLVERTRRLDDGRELRWFEHDPDYRPELPIGAVRGDVYRQHFCRLHNVPMYFYIDEERTCVQCRSKFTFYAKEQKYWYETLGFNLASMAIRCLRCRRERRTEAALRQQFARLTEELASRPRDPDLLLELGKVTVEYRARTGQGNLDRGIAACRAAREEWPQFAEPLFWEARCHELAGRTGKAATLSMPFLSRRRERRTWRSSGASPKRPSRPWNARGGRRRAERVAGFHPRWDGGFVRR